MTTNAVTDARKALGKELRARREAAGFTQQQLADYLGYSRPRVAGAEKGDSCALLFWQGCDKILNAGGALVDGFEQIEAVRRREAEQAVDAARAQREQRARTIRERATEAADYELKGFSGKSHKFIATYIGSEPAERIASRIPVKSASPPQWFECCTAEIAHSGGSCQLYLWPFGVAIFHLAEDLAMPNISRLALWRIQSYDENLAWATAHLRKLGATDSASASYVLSVYWINDHEWPNDIVDTALRVICAPRILLQREPGGPDAQQHRAEETERRLLANGFEHDGIRPFGLSGISAGYASWSGVVYHPRFPEQSLTEDNFICCELATQAIWAYCERINQQVEQGRDPVVPEQYGWRFLRGVRSRLTNPRPQETGQHRSMRDALIETSGLLGHLDQAIDVLSQIPGK